MDLNKRLFLSGLIAIFIAYFYQFIISKTNTNSIESELIESWDEYIRLPEENRNLTILLGYDLILLVLRFVFNNYFFK
jgi:hypothetical protein